MKIFPKMNQKLQPIDHSANFFTYGNQVAESIGGTSNMMETQIDDTNSVSAENELNHTAGYRQMALAKRGKHWCTPEGSGYHEGAQLTSGRTTSLPRHKEDR